MLIKFREEGVFSTQDFGECQHLFALDSLSLTLLLYLSEATFHALITRIQFDIAGLVLGKITTAVSLSRDQFLQLSEKPYIAFLQNLGFIIQCGSITD